MEFTLTYLDATAAAQTGTAIAAGTAVSENQALKAGQKVKVRMLVKFKETDDTSVIPSTEVNVTGMDAVITYEQN